MKMSITCLFLALIISGSVSYLSGSRANAFAASAYDCEGNACSSITLTWDDTKQLYHVQNSSTTRWVRVDVTSQAGAMGLCVGPSRSEDLPLKNLTGKYHANYNEESCVRSN